MTTGQSELLKAIGVKGLSIFSGVLREEYLTDLRDWNKAAKVYREMADDAVVGTLLDSIITPLLAADFDVPPLTDAEADQKAALFVYDNILNLSKQPWRSHVNDMLECLIFGFAIAEVVMEKRDDGKLWLKNLEPRGQETLLRWNGKKTSPSALYNAIL